MKKIIPAMFLLLFLHENTWAADIEKAQLKTQTKESFYTKIFAGAAFIPDVELDTTGTAFTSAELSQNAGFTIGGAIGTQLNDYFAAEVEYSFQRNDLDSLDVASAAATASTPLSGDLTQHYIFANGILTLPEFRQQRVEPFILGGIGLSVLSLDFAIPGVPGAFADDDVNFAFQLGGGVSFDFTDKIDLELSYRFRGLPNSATENLPSNHLALVGLKYSF